MSAEAEPVLRSPTENTMESVALPGFLISSKEMYKFTGRLVMRGRVWGPSLVIPLAKQEQEPEFTERAIKGAELVLTHSLGDRALGENDSWPSRGVFIVNPPTKRGAISLAIGAVKAANAVARGSTDNHKELFWGSVGEAISDPGSTLRMGLKGRNYDAIERLADYYSQLSRSDRPDVHVIVGERDAMFDYGDKFERTASSAGFKLHKVDCAHNAPYTRPERVLEVIERELDQL